MTAHTKLSATVNVQQLPFLTASAPNPNDQVGSNLASTLRYRDARSSVQQRKQRIKRSQQAVKECCPNLFKSICSLIDQPCQVGPVGQRHIDAEDAGCLVGM